MKLIIDVGHGGNDPGASSFGYLEKDLNLVIAKRVRELLKDYSPDMTRSTDIALDSSPRTALIKSKYDYCLSIHLNAGGGSGIETIHALKSIKGKKLAESIANNLKKTTGLSIRRVFDRARSDGKNYYYMHRDTGSTITVIIECLFIDSEYDIKYINVESISQGIAKGFEEFIRGKEPIEEVVEINRLLKNGSKGEDVKELQKKLTEIGFYIGAIDGIFGPASERAVKAFQSANTLSADGIVGPATWKALNAEKKTKFTHYKSGGTDVIELDPLDLRISIQDKEANKINLSNYVTSGYQWHHDNGVTYPLGILVSEGKVISNTQPHGKPAGTLIVYKDGSVKVKELLNINGEKDVWFAVSGCSVLPKINMTSGGFVGAYSDIGRSANRPLIGYNPTKKKVIIAVRKTCSINTGQTILRNLGCSVGITLDAGGSTVLKVNNKLIYNTSRRLYSVLSWG